MSTTSNSATTTLYVNGRPAQDELARLRTELEAAFHFKHQFQGHLDDAIAKDKSEDPKDVELVFNDYTREMAIIHEMEWHHEWKDGKGLQDDAPQGFTQPHEPTIHELLTKLHDLPMVTYKTLRAYVGEQVTTLQGRDGSVTDRVVGTEFAHSFLI